MMYETDGTNVNGTLNMGPKITGKPKVTCSLILKSVVGITTKMQAKVTNAGINGLINWRFLARL
jgi:hypothetical protein